MKKLCCIFSLMVAVVFCFTPVISNDAEIPVTPSQKSVEFMDKLTGYSNFIKTNGIYFSRSNFTVCKTFSQTKAMIKKKQVTRANCVMLVDWALKEMGLLSTNANLLQQKKCFLCWSPCQHEEKFNHN